MPLVLQIKPPDGPMRSVVLEPGRNVVVANPAEQYRLVGERGEITEGARVRRVGNALVVDGLPRGDELELGNFFGACRPERDCALVLEAPGAPAATVTNESLPLAALSDGSFLLYGASENALPAAAAAGSDTAGPSPGLMAAAGLAALVGLGAGLGGGGGSGNASTASSGTAVLGSTETAPAPTTATTPPAATPPAATPVTPAPGAPADTTPPSLTITDGTAAAITNGPVTFSFRFTEAVTGFTAEDVVVAGGAKGTLVALADGLSYTMAITPTANVQSGLITVDVAAGAARDAAGNASVAATRAVQGYDTAPPVLSVTDDVPGVANRTTVFTFSFSEPVTGFGDADITVTGGARGLLGTVTEGRTYTLAVAPPAGAASGQIGVDVVAAAVTDAVGNPNAAVRATQAIDTLPPTQRVSTFTLFDDAPPRVGNLVLNEPTNDASPTVTLTLNAVLGPGEVLSVIRDGITVRTVNSGAGTSFDDGPLSRGNATHVYSASIVDAAGNSTLLDLNGAAAGTAFSIIVI